MFFIMFSNDVFITLIIGAFNVIAGMLFENVLRTFPFSWDKIGSSK